MLGLHSSKVLGALIQQESLPGGHEVVDSISKTDCRELAPGCHRCPCHLHIWNPCCPMMTCIEVAQAA